MTADASTGGGSVALGGAFGVTVIHDNAVARLNNSVTNDAADSAITVSASVNTTQSVNTTAGVTGGVKGTAGKNGSAGSADKQVDSILGGAGNIAANSNRSGSLSMKGSGSDDRQKAQTSEGSVGGAAAVAVNVLFTQALARIMNGANIAIGGAVKVQSVNRTETQVKANASTAKTDAGVGAAVAVNIVNIENTAEIGDGALALKLKLECLPECILCLCNICGSINCNTLTVADARHCSHQLCHLHRITGVDVITSVRSCGCVLSDQGGRCHLAAGHSVDRIVNKYDREFLGSDCRMHNFRHTFGNHISVSLIAEDEFLRVRSLDTGGSSRSTSVERHECIHVIVTV